MTPENVTDPVLLIMGAPVPPIIGPLTRILPAPENVIPLEPRSMAFPVVGAKVKVLPESLLILMLLKLVLLKVDVKVLLPLRLPNVADDPA